MNAYDATYVTTFVSPDDGGQITAKQVIAQLIDGESIRLNGEWTHSMRWPKDYGWIEQAKRDLASELLGVNERMEELKKAEKLLNSIHISGEK